MIFYLILIITFTLDYITLHQSRNHRDKKVYTIAMILVGIIGIAFLKYSDNIQIAPKVLELINFYGGNK